MLKGCEKAPAQIVAYAGAGVTLGDSVEGSLDLEISLDRHLVVHRIRRQRQQGFEHDARGSPVVSSFHIGSIPSEILQRVATVFVAANPVLAAAPVSTVRRTVTLGDAEKPTSHEPIDLIRLLAPGTLTKSSLSAALLSGA